MIGEGTMGDREAVAATLTAALMRSLPNAGFKVPAGGGVIDKVEIARHAVSLYETIFGMLPNRPS